jgi:hypothetical protein
MGPCCASIRSASLQSLIPRPQQFENAATHLSFRIAKKKKKKKKVRRPSLSRCID